jgi:hypothetical protein
MTGNGGRINRASFPQSGLLQIGVAAFWIFPQKKHCNAAG